MTKQFIFETIDKIQYTTYNSGMIFRSETAFTNSLQAYLDLEIKYILDYNSEPAEKKKTDTQIVAGIKYKF
ncbi:MAG: DUF481 domain-containing protein [Candidatus Omnitrophota bacterium]